MATAAPEGASPRRTVETAADVRHEIDKLFEVQCKHEASDLHMKVGAPPLLRIAGSIRELDAPPLKGAEIKKLLYDILSDEQKRWLEDNGDLDFAYGVPGVGRFRINAFFQRGSISMACRRVNVRIPSFKDLHLPGKALKKIASFKQGLVVLAGITGSGKSTTIAGMIEFINENRRCHIVTIEDPIEYLFSDKKSFINQREVGIDVPSFGKALRTVVRQDPDVILIGEMRDHETFNVSLTAAETGHLVFSTIHASTVPQTLGRVLDLFPPDQQESIRKGLSFNLKSIICQKLLPSVKEGIGRVPAVEILIVNATITKLISEGRDKDLANVIRAGEEDGMCDFNQSLVKLIQGGLISEKIGLAYSHNPEQLRMNLKGIYLADDKQILGTGA